MQGLPPVLWELIANIPSEYAVQHVYGTRWGRILLVLTHPINRREHDLQNWINDHYPGQRILVLSHTVETVIKEAGRGHPFFNRVLRNNVLLHGHSLTIPAANPLPLPPVCLARAQNFYRLAYASSVEDNSLCLFLLHQCLEQCAMQFILSLTGYRVDSHSLPRLLLFCREIAPHLIFTSQELLPLLNRAYLSGRYEVGFDPTLEECQNLLQAVYDFKKEIIVLTCQLTITDHEANVYHHNASWL